LGNPGKTGTEFWKGGASSPTSLEKTEKKKAREGREAEGRELQLPGQKNQEHQILSSVTPPTKIRGGNRKGKKTGGEKGLIVQKTRRKPALKSALWVEHAKGSGGEKKERAPGARGIPPEERSA